MLHIVLQNILYPSIMMTLCVVKWRALTRHILGYITPIVYNDVTPYAFWACRITSSQAQLVHMYEQGDRLTMHSPRMHRNYFI